MVWVIPKLQDSSKSSNRMIHVAETIPRPSEKGQPHIESPGKNRGSKTSRMEETPEKYR